MKKTVDDELVRKVNDMKISSTSGLVSKTQFDSDKQNLKKEDWRWINKYQILIS